MCGHDEMRKHELLHCLRRIDTCQLHQFLLDTVWSKIAEKIELSPSRGLRTPIGQVDNRALWDAIDCLVRFVDEATQIFGKPVIAPGLSAVTVHALLDHCPASIVGDDETVQIKIEAILDCCAVHFGDQPTCSGQGRAIQTDHIANGDKLMWRLARVAAASAADMDAKFSAQRCQAALQRQ